MTLPNNSMEAKKSKSSCGRTHTDTCLDRRSFVGISAAASAAAGLGAAVLGLPCALAEEDASEADAPDCVQIDIDGTSVWFTLLEDGTVSVGHANVSGGTDYAVDAEYEGALNIPAQVEIDGSLYEVSRIAAYAFSNGSSKGCAFSSVSIPETVIEIEQAAFMSCDGLEEVNFASEGSLQTIGPNSFQRCFSLKKIEIPASVETVGDYAFSYCTSLEEATFAEGSRIATLGAAAFRCNANMPGALKSFVYPAVDTIASYVLSYQVQLESIEFLGESYSYFETEALRSCTSLKYLEIPPLTGPKTILDQPARLQLLCAGYCTSLETVVFKGDAHEYMIWSNREEQHPFEADFAISSVVYWGTIWDGSTGGVQSQNNDDDYEGMQTATALFPYSLTTPSVYYKVDFYSSRALAEECVASGANTDESILRRLFLRSDVCSRDLLEGTLVDEQVFEGSVADLPEASYVWAFSGFAADDRLRRGTYAFDAAEDDIASCVITLNTSGYICGLEEVAPSWTVVSHEGVLLSEGSDYTTSLLKSSVSGQTSEADYDDIQLEGDYQVHFEGIGEWSGDAVANFEVATVYLDCDVLGTDVYEVAGALAASLYEAGRGGTALLVSSADARYTAVAAAAAKALDAPILLCAPDSLPDATAAELRREETASVILVGDQSVISEDVRQEIANLRTTPSVSRLTYTDPHEAALGLYKQFVAAALEDDSSAYVIASDTALPASLVIGRAYVSGAPIFFASSDGTLEPSVRNLLKTAGFKTIVSVSETEDSTDILAYQVGNTSVVYESVVGQTYETLEEEYSRALEANDVSFVVLIDTDGIDTANLILSCLYASTQDAAAVVIQDMSDADDFDLVLLRTYAAHIKTLRFVESDGTFSPDDINLVIGTWGAVMDEWGIVDNGSNDDKKR